MRIRECSDRSQMPRQLAAVLFLLFLCSLVPGTHIEQDSRSKPWDLQDIIIVSTVDRRLLGLDIASGKIRWQFSDEPPAQSTPNGSFDPGFTFFPSYQDGSLYQMRKGELRKMPFSIPQVVSSAPCKGNDGMLYAGSKKDEWIGLNPFTGERVERHGTGKPSTICPASHDDVVFIGRTEFALTMVDPADRQRSWNTTFVDYSYLVDNARSAAYPLHHLVSSSTGDILAIDKKSGSFVWKISVGQPVAAMYLIKKPEGLLRIDAMPVGSDVLNNIAENSDPSVWRDLLTTASSPSSKTGYYPAVYIGESTHGLFASQVYVDGSTPTIGRSTAPLLLDGPDGTSGTGDGSRPIFDAEQIVTTKDVIILGYHEPPPEATEAAVPDVRFVSPSGPGGGPGTKRIDYIPEDDGPKVIPHVLDSQRPSVLLQDETIFHLIGRIYERYPTFFMALCGTIVVLFGTTVWLCGRQSTLADLEARSAQASRVSVASSRDGIEEDGREGSRGGGGGGGGGNKRNRGLQGWIPVGKLEYNASEVLGTGCEGTVVYKGRFDGREVAVKRVLTEFLPLVDREVEYLRESDSHPNVIRYFCCESDSQFRYLALELCAGSLYDYVERKKDLRGRLPITEFELLKQATDGLKHLHEMKIVHRDLKPQNVLINVSGGGRASAVISDFGLCKRLNPGRMSLSRRSGLAGTDGWIAPEALKRLSTSFPMDIFSLGCIYYYVLTDGKHPYGEPLHRNGNIFNGSHRLDDLPELESRRFGHLIEAMLAASPTRRPTAAAVLLHPFFWDTARQLQFFSDVSDRVEKEPDLSPITRRLEKSGRFVVKMNWRERICEHLQEDLRKFRTYKGHSVRDLLRAMRNKKHHYRELPEEVRLSLGEIPHDFVAYFTTRFPELLMHVYEAIEWCAEETVFVHYYSEEVRVRIRDVRAETEKRMTEESSDNEVWQRGVAPPPSDSPSPQTERKRIVLLPRSKPPSESTALIESDKEEERRAEREEEEEQPKTLVPPSELLPKNPPIAPSMKADVSIEAEVEIMMGPPPGLEGIRREEAVPNQPAPANGEEATTPTGGAAFQEATTKKKRKKR